MAFYTGASLCSVRWELRAAVFAVVFVVVAVVVVYLMA
jgi:hypothetical protein